MVRTYDPARRCFKVSEWPTEDQAAWERALTCSDLLSPDSSPAADWRPETAGKNRRGYGRWLAYLEVNGIDMAESPAARATPAQVTAYLNHLLGQGIGIYTLRNRIAELLAVMLVLAPDRDWTWLKRRLNHLDTEAKEQNVSKLPYLLATDVVARACRELRQIERISEPFNVARAVTYRDWLMMATLALQPLRRRNFATLELGRTLKHGPLGWTINLPGTETKTSREYLAPFPEKLLPHLDFYLDHVRPVLLGQKQSAILWVARGGQRACAHTIGLRIAKLTRRSFGTALSPHKFRHLAATTISIVAPEKIDTARALLGHTSRKTTTQHYVRADSISASRDHGRIVAFLKKATRHSLPQIGSPTKSHKTKKQRP